LIGSTPIYFAFSSAACATGNDFFPIHHHFLYDFDPHPPVQIIFKSLWRKGVNQRGFSNM
jgi:hypothetical protein